MAKAKKPVVNTVSSFTLNIAKRVQETRQKMGLTTTDLAQMVGMSQAQVSRLENGKQGFRSATLHKVADALKVKAAYLVNGDKKPSASSLLQDQTFYGPGMSQFMIDALSSEKYKAFVMKSARIFMGDEATFSQLSAMVRKAKLKHKP